MNEQMASIGKLAALIGFMAFLFINLLAGGVLTIAAFSVLTRFITGV